MKKKAKSKKPERFFNLLGNFEGMTKTQSDFMRPLLEMLSTRQLQTMARGLHVRANPSRVKTINRLLTCGHIYVEAIFDPEKFSFDVKLRFTDIHETGELIADSIAKKLANPSPFTKLIQQGEFPIGIGATLKEVVTPKRKIKYRA